MPSYYAVRLTRSSYSSCHALTTRRSLGDSLSHFITCQNSIYVMDILDLAYNIWSNLKEFSFFALSEVFQMCLQAAGSIDLPMGTIIVLEF